MTIGYQTVVAEVLSSSTQHIDRREKAMNYFREGSIAEYVVLSQEDRRAVIHRRARESSLLKWLIATMIASTALACTIAKLIR